MTDQPHPDDIRHIILLYRDSREEPVSYLFTSDDLAARAFAKAEKMEDVDFAIQFKRFRRYKQ